MGVDKYWRQKQYFEANFKFVFDFTTAAGFKILNIVQIGFSCNDIC
jgi:hypothetical protein